MPILMLSDSDPEILRGLLARFGLELRLLPAGADIPGSHWGESEAGLVRQTLFARPDTPLHSLLHEACHYACMSPQRRASLHTDAGGEDLEENGVCYLQVLLAAFVPGMDRTRLFADMDKWGYSFRLGSAQRWFEEDAEDAREWLLRQGLIVAEGQPTWALRKA